MTWDESWKKACGWDEGIRESRLYGVGKVVLRSRLSINQAAKPTRKKTGKAGILKQVKQ